MVLVREMMEYGDSIQAVVQSLSSGTEGEGSYKLY